MGKTVSIAEKRALEQGIVLRMIKIYCHKMHGTKTGLCAECAELETYAKSRSERCPFIETKTFCSNCKAPCYKPAMREKIRIVMRTAGPWMIFYDPKATLRHLIESIKEKRNLRNAP